MNYLESRLNQGNATAANNVTNWSGTCYITPLIGAFLADAYLGRYWTIATFVFIYVFVSLIFSANDLSLKYQVLGLLMNESHSSGNNSLICKALGQSKSMLNPNLI